ncbi:hypothetical protein LPJ79_001999 [Coemansia sp. RSA 1821]|nr:hypothetical protein LPJ79_001999 [Coemansia sp. RSA 1821]
MAEVTGSKSSSTVDWSQVRIHGTGNRPGSLKPTINFNRVMVDKSLVCKALFDIDATMVRVCAPAGFGKTLNLKTISTVFNIINCNDMPGSQIYQPIPKGSLKKLDPNVAPWERKKLVEFLLIEQEAEFFNRHYCRYPVISIDFSTLKSAESLQHFCLRLYLGLGSSVHYWLYAFHTEQLEQTQKELFQELLEIYASIAMKLRAGLNDPQEGFNVYCQLFSKLFEFLKSVCPEKHIILVDCYDFPLMACQGKPWEQQARQVYFDILHHLLKTNEQLLKCVFAGVYNMPLDGLDVLTVAPALNMCCSSSSQILGSMFGITRSELNELGNVLHIPEQDIEDASASFGGYSFTPRSEYLSAQKAMEFYCANLPNHSMYRLKYHTIPQPAKIVKTIIREASPLLFILVLRLLNGSDTCFIWPSWELKAEHCHSADELLFNFVFDPSAHPGNINSLDKIVTLLVYLGYLTINADNALQIPNNGVRDMWENLRLLATFGTIVPTQQDTMRQQIIDSLYTGNTDLLHVELSSAFQKLAPLGFSQQMQIEFISRWVLSKLTVAKHTFERQSTTLEYDLKFLANPQLNTPWSITLLPFGRYIQSLKVTFSFIGSGKAEITVNTF